MAIIRIRRPSTRNSVDRAEALRSTLRALQKNASVVSWVSGASRHVEESQSICAPGDARHRPICSGEHQTGLTTSTVRAVLTWEVVGADGQAVRQAEGLDAELPPRRRRIRAASSATRWRQDRSRNDP